MVRLGRAAPAAVEARPVAQAGMLSAGLRAKRAVPRADRADLAEAKAGEAAAEREGAAPPVHNQLRSRPVRRA